MKTELRTLKLSGLILMALMTSCGRHDSSGAKDESAQTSSMATIKTENLIQKNGVIFRLKRLVELNEDFSNLEDVKEKLNTFVISAELTRAATSATYLRCSKYIGGNDYYPTVKIPEGARNDELEVSLTETDLNVKVSCQMIEGKKEILSGEFILKKSLYIDKKSKLKSFAIGSDKDGLVLDRLIIDRDAGLYVGAESVNLKVKDFYSNEGTVGTFLESDRTPDPLLNKIGENGGNIHLNVGKIYGFLNIEMLGMNGGNQIQVPDQKAFPGLMDDPARNSESAALHHGGVCVKGAQAGLPGVQGDTGFAGNPGGNSGKFNLIAETASLNFEYKSRIEAGLGGLGGAGGAGSEGSNGGWSSAYCDEAPKGPAGPQGAQGEVGAKGKEESVKITIKSETKNN